MGLAKRVLVTGGTGTLGHALIPKLLDRGDLPVVFSRDEYKQNLMSTQYPMVEFVLGDVRSYDSVYDATSGIQAVIHAAALKRIEIGERQPWEFIQTNVLGSRHVVASARNRGIMSAVLVSSDKAVYPINTYGVTKALAEKLFLGAGYSAVRYGNVLGSRGSLLEIVDRCREEDRPIPITDPRMTRFFWTVEEAADFVLEHMDTPGLHIPDLQGKRIVDLIQEAAPDHPMQEVGVGPGEKLHEWLETEEENPDALPSGPNIFRWPPEAQEDPLTSSQVFHAHSETRGPSLGLPWSRE
jgi:UDP-N-acetylglucosamine 4,6-dehydratase